MKNTRYKASKAFTLSEVLITLVILGIIVALTIPSLINKKEKQEWRTGLNVGYAIVSQAITAMKADGVSAYDDFDYNAIANFDANDPKAFYPLFRTYFNVTKDCTGGKCGDIRNCPSNIYQNYMNTVGLCMSYQGHDLFQISNGMLVMVDYAQLNWVNAPHGGPVHITIDVNGYNKKPNTYGKDVFVFELLPGNKLVPVGSQINGAFFGNLWLSCSNSSVADNRYNGVGCAYYAMIDKSPDDPTKSYWDDFLR